MKKLIKTISIMLAAVLCGAMLAGCGNGTGDADTSADNSKTVETSKKDKKDKKDSDEVLIMGTNATFQPFEYVDENGIVGDFDGIDVAIALRIAENAGKTLEVADQDFNGLISSVSTGKVDMVLAGLTVTEERAKNVDFSEPYYVASQVMVVSPDNKDITCAEDLKKGKKVGVVIGYTGDLTVTDTLKIDDNNIQRGDTALAIIQDVKNGRLDAAVVDSYTGIALADKLGLSIVEDPEVFETEEYAIAVKKGNTKLLKTINETLEEMKENGEIDELTKKYGAIEAE